MVTGARHVLSGAADTAIYATVRSYGSRHLPLLYKGRTVDTQKVGCTKASPKKGRLRLKRQICTDRRIDGPVL